MASKVTSYKCPNCTGPFKFSSESGKLECEYCGSSFTVEEVEKFYAAKDAKAAAAAAQDTPQVARGEVPKKNKTAAQAAGDKGQKKNKKQAALSEAAQSAALSAEQKDRIAASEWDASTISDDWGEDSKNVVACTCPSCGAEMMTEATSIAARCPYCGNENIKVGEIAGALKPDLIIPFKLDKQAAIDGMKNHIKGKWFLPRAFKKNSEIKKIQGIYVPFWLFEGKASAECYYEGVNESKSRSGGLGDCHHRLL